MYGLGGTCPTPGVACASSELKACMASAGIANRGRSSAPVPAVNWVTLGSLWPWCTSPGQWLSWPKGDGVKCNRSEGPRRESRSDINETHPFITCRSSWYSPIAMIYEGPSLFLSTYLVVTSIECATLRRFLEREKSFFLSPALTFASKVPVPTVPLYVAFLPRYVRLHTCHSSCAPALGPRSDQISTKCDPLLID